MALELRFRIKAGIRLNHIPYKSGAPALADLMGGQIKFYFSNAAASTNLVKAGSLRAIAHMGRGRLAAFPNLPPVSDTLPGYEAYEWNGVFVPAGTPRAIIERLNTGLNAGDSRALGRRAPCIAQYSDAPQCPAGIRQVRCGRNGKVGQRHPHREHQA